MASAVEKEKYVHISRLWMLVLAVAVLSAGLAQPVRADLIGAAPLVVSLNDDGHNNDWIFPAFWYAGWNGLPPYGPYDVKIEWGLRCQYSTYTDNDGGSHVDADIWIPFGSASDSPVCVWDFPGAWFDSYHEVINRDPKRPDHSSDIGKSWYYTRFISAGTTRVESMCYAYGWNRPHGVPLDP